MKLSFVDRLGGLDPGLRRSTQRRLLFALSRFGSRVEAVKIVAEEGNGPCGGFNACCRISVRLRRLPTVSVETEGITLRAAIAAGTDRIGTAVSRAIDKDETLGRWSAARA